jgi:Rrf2 family protein
MITHSLDYALRGLFYLAALPPGEVRQVKTIAAQTHVPPAYLAKLFAAMARAGIVRPQRGLRGGYVLSRAPAQITLRCVVESLSGDMSLGLDNLRCAECGLNDTCRAKSPLAQVAERVRDVFDGVTLERLMYDQPRPGATGD